MRSPLDAVPFDYEQDWVRGYEYVREEGSSFWKELRERHGWSREDVWELSAAELDPAIQAQIEGDWNAGGLWDLDHLIAYATITGRKPGELLDEYFESKGRALREEEERDAVA